MLSHNCSDDIQKKKKERVSLHQLYIIFLISFLTCIKNVLFTIDGIILNHNLIVDDVIVKYFG